MTVGTILVAVDGSPNSAAALGWAASVAGDLGARVVAVHALGLLERGLGGGTVPVEGHVEEIGRRFRDEWCAPVRDAGVPYEALTIHGPAVQVLLRAAEETGAGMIVLGGRGQDRPGPLSVIGSTSHQVANQASCPVVIVPPPRHPA